MKSTGVKKPLLARVLGYALLAVFVFLTGVWLFFPYGEVARRAEAELAKRGIEAEITGLGPRTPLSYRIKSVHVTRAMGKETDLRVNDAVVSLSPAHLLDGRVGVNVAGVFLGGEVEAAAVVPAPDSVRITWKAMALGPVTRLFSEQEIPLNGLSDGVATVGLPYEGVSKLDANVEAELTNLSFGPYNTLGFAINPIALGAGKVRAEVVKGKARIFDTSLNGGDVAATVEGTVQFSPALAASRLEGAAELKPSRQFENEYFMVLSLLAPYKNPAGGFNLNIGGTVASPTVRPR